jgi:Rod binding domain-containing protein
VKNITTLSPQPAPSAASPSAQASRAGDPRIKEISRQFEATFMSEMIRLARPTEQSGGSLDTSRSEDTWRYFMDQALGQAMTDSANQDSGLRRLVERDLNAAEGKSLSQKVKS